MNSMKRFLLSLAFSLAMSLSAFGQDIIELPPGTRAVAARHLIDDKPTVANVGGWLVANGAQVDPQRFPELYIYLGRRTQGPTETINGPVFLPIRSGWAINPSAANGYFAGAMVEFELGPKT